MIITCEACRTAYYLDTGILKTDGSTVCCSKCGHTFKAAPPPPMVVPPQRPNDFTGEIAPKRKRRTGLLLLMLILLAVVGSAVIYNMIQKPEGNSAIAPQAPAKAVQTEASKAPVKQPSATASNAADTEAARVVVAGEPAPAGHTSAKPEAVQHRWIQNTADGLLLVISGVVPRPPGEETAARAVRSVLYDKNGTPVDQQLVFAGHSLTEDELKTFPRSTLMARLTAPPDPVAAGSTSDLPFMAIFAAKVEELDEFTLELIEKIPDRQ